MNPIDVLKAFYNAVSHGDAVGALATLNPELEWTEAEGFPYYSGTWRTPDDVLQKLMIPLSRDWDGFTASAHEFFSGGDAIVALGIYAGKNRHSGKSIRVPFAHRWELKNGKIFRFDMYTDTYLIRQAA